MVQTVRPYQKLIGVLPALTFIVVYLSPSLFADSESRRQATRTALVKNATGDPSAVAANPGYEAYINSVLDLNTDPAQNVTNREFGALVSVAPPPADPYLLTVEKEKTPQINEKSKLETRENRLSDLQKPLDSQVRATEDSYWYERNKAERLYEEAERNQGAGTSAADSGTREAKSESEDSSLRPSLANNPFYFSQTGGTDYSETKTLMTSRLVQMGYTRLEAQNLLENTASPEDALLALMQKEGFSYGDATNIVGTSQNTAPPARDQNSSPE